ncbi:sensor histidine kinase [Plastorhodobacter daqingensis]|uniref:histidine kinase n=1 Tax=Plastorhodobacter daqingensis TaxID=1387281 RepID=A0ABW2UKS1_9RHOB
MRLRLMLGALSLAALAVFAAGLAVHGLSQAERLGAAAVAAQQRMEAYSALSARVNERVLASLAGPADPTQEESAETRAVLASLAHLDGLIAADVAAARTAAEADRRAAPARVIGRIRGQFIQLSETLDSHPPGSGPVLAALSLYGLQVPPLLTEQIDHERRRRDEAMRSLSGLRRRLGGLAVGVAVAAPALLAVLWMLVLRPLRLRLQAAARAAGAVGQGRAPLEIGPGDELSLVFARINQMSSRLDRRQRRLAQDHARLETTVAERTGQLRRANDRLARIDAERRRFFADVSHELRTPLTVILGEAELALRGVLAPPLAEAFTTIRSRARRLFRRIEDLLRIARSEDGQLDLQRQPVALGPLVAAALDDLRPLLGSMAVRLDLPPSLAVVGDADWIRQVIGGIIENAAKYAGPGAQLAITAQGLGDRVRISLADTGPGLPPGLADRALDRFARGTGTAAGFGVGLALARWVIEAQDGSIALVSPAAEGRGLRVEITLPAARPEPARAEAREEAPWPVS